MIRHPLSRLATPSIRRTFPTINISITHHCGSCDFDEGEDDNKELSAASSPDDESFLRVSGLLLMIALEAKNVNSERKRTGAGTGEISISHRARAAFFAQRPPRTASSITAPVTVVSHKQIKRQDVCQYENYLKTFLFDQVWSEMAWLRQTTELEHEELCGFNETHTGGQRMFEKWESWVHFAAPAFVLKSADDKAFFGFCKHDDVRPGMFFRFLPLSLWDRNRWTIKHHKTLNNGSFFFLAEGDREN